LEPLRLLDPGRTARILGAWVRIVDRRFDAQAQKIASVRVRLEQALDKSVSVGLRNTHNVGPPPRRPATSTASADVRQSPARSFGRRHTGFVHPVPFSSQRSGTPAPPRLDSGHVLPEVSMNRLLGATILMGAVWVTAEAATLTVD
jgi:hypothetical protein